MRQRSLAIAALTALLTSSVVEASSIGIAFNADGTDCDRTIPANTFVSWYIFAYLGGDPGACGITGAEFRQDGTPSAWFMSAFPSPQAISSTGNPIAGGCSVTFSPCEPGTNGVVLLYTINGFATSAPPYVTLSIRPHTTPSHPSFACPVLFLCDTPSTRICVPGGEAFINGTVCEAAVASQSGSPCPIGVELTTWSGVKSLYD